MNANWFYTHVLVISLTVVLAGCAWNLTGNTGTTPTSNFVGTTDNVAFEIRVNNERALRIEPTGIAPNFIAGDSSNNVSQGVLGATIFGGVCCTANIQRVVGDYGTVSGGRHNQAGFQATVGGGYENTASLDNATVAGGTNNVASGFNSTVGGGGFNTASATLATVAGGGGNKAIGTRGSTVAGGMDNTASGTFEATVGGGVQNTASGYQSTVPGGAFNTAAGPQSFAAGNRAKIDANHYGAFVWSDASNFDFASTAPNQFAVRATGGMNVVSAIDGTGAPTAGVVLGPGSGAWSTLSDGALKENFKALDGRDILRRLGEISILEWNYKAQDASIRHIGPTAQDFYASFGLGETNRYISTSDADGVALAAIQGLYEIVLQHKAAQATLRERSADLEARVASLETLVLSLVRGHNRDGKGAGDDVR